MTEFEKMVQLLDAAWLMRREIVPCLIGPPGIGKTAAVMQHAEKHGSKVVKIVASRCVPSETVGMTMPDHKNHSMEIYNSMQLSSLRDGDILFLDELLEAEQFVLSTLLTVIESREMADGTPLPDIQIVAATNDTIPPEQLRGNIKQRFMFQRFKMDTNQTIKYIKSKTGITPPDSAISMLRKSERDNSGEYNFMTPRSLTKLCMWMDAAKDEFDMYLIGNVIDGIWGFPIGQDIYEARQKRDDDRKRKKNSPDMQVRKAVNGILANMQANGQGVYEDIPEKFSFESCSMTELFEMLQGLPEWEEIAKQLAALEIQEEDEIKF